MAIPNRYRDRYRNRKEVGFDELEKTGCIAPCDKLHSAGYGIEEIDSDSDSDPDKIISQQANVPDVYSFTTGNSPERA